jgi:hypothetical protein
MLQNPKKKLYEIRCDKLINTFKCDEWIQTKYDELFLSNLKKEKEQV